MRKDFGYDGVELDGKRPHGNPMDLDRKARERCANVLEREGLEIPCVAANNDFSSPIPEHRECQLADGPRAGPPGRPTSAPRWSACSPPGTACRSATARPPTTWSAAPSTPWSGSIPTPPGRSAGTMPGAA